MLTRVVHRPRTRPSYIGLQTRAFNLFPVQIMERLYTLLMALMSRVPLWNIKFVIVKIAFHTVYLAGQRMQVIAWTFSSC
jgi:hypothetical protein